MMSVNPFRGFLKPIPNPNSELEEFALPPSDFSLDPVDELAVALQNL